MAMSTNEIAEERQRGRLAGVAAIAAGVLFPIGLVWSLSVNGDRPTDNDPAELRFAHHHATPLVVSSLIRALAAFLIVAVAVHLYKATRARNPDVNRVVLVTAIVGPIGFALGSVAFEVFYAVISADFAGREFQTVAAAKDLIESPFRIIAGAISTAGSLAFAFWFVLGSLNAMRVGLLTRFMGIIGIVIGPGLLLLPPIPFVMAFWLVALGLLFLGYWPRGVPPAWNRGEAVPWPSMTEPAPQTAPEEESGSRNGEVEAVGPAVRKPQQDRPAMSGSPPRRKRKRKR
jgi:Domain of unknown function (DUF4386)